MRMFLKEFKGKQYAVRLYRESDRRITYELYTEDDEHWFPLRESSGFHSTFWLTDLHTVLVEALAYIKTLSINEWHTENP